MKTPKEILLQRHQGAESKLDAIRRNALASIEQPSATPWWREFVFSMRWHLAGLGAVWAVVVFLHMDFSSNRAVTVASDKIPPARLLMAALMENQREILELTGPPPAIAPAVPPPRRSEIQSTVEIV
jgi:hypothetical protein